MRTVIVSIIVGAVSLGLGLTIGAWQSSQLKSSEAGRWVSDAAQKIPIPKGSNQDGDDSNFESNEYPTLKWKAKPLSDAPGAIVRLWTTFENGPKNDPQGSMKYKLTLFKATKKDGREVQILDGMGFKLFQFGAIDFHEIPGAPDIVESRDAVPCTEEVYRKARDYSVK